MAKAQVKGIKCDTVLCDYVDMEVPFTDYPQWLNRPCPKCGANLLTQADFDAVISLVRIAEEQPDDEGETDFNMSVSFDGTGEPKLESVELTLTSDAYKTLRAMIPWWVRLLHAFKIPYSYTIVPRK